jgi:hypothetical protein
MMVGAIHADRTEIGDEHARVQRVAVYHAFGQEIHSIQKRQKPQHEPDQDQRTAGGPANLLIDGPLVMRPRFVNGGGDLFRGLWQRFVRGRYKELDRDERLITRERLLGRKRQLDVFALIKTPAGDETIHRRSVMKTVGDRPEKQMEQSRTLMRASAVEVPQPLSGPGNVVNSFVVDGALIATFEDERHELSLR